MYPWLLALGTCCIIVLIYFTASKIIPKLNSRRKRPPSYSGWIPWLGCALEFGQNPLKFIDLMGHKLGPVYTLKVAGEHMTFLTDAEDFHHFFQSSNVDFQRAVQNSVQKVASVTEEAFFKNHTKIHDTVKGRLSVPKLSPYYPTLHSKFQEYLMIFKNQRPVNCGSEIELYELVRSTMYKSVMENLFGAGTLPTDNEAAFKELEKNFVIFDEQFEYGAKLPALFLKSGLNLKLAAGFIY
ncbi:hypothetical protein Btru_020478 [Bulinus truncatus]|nr:hypothetical protein Btru_020478 [Bulinus truncatus]